MVPGLQKKLIAQLAVAASLCGAASVISPVAQAQSEAGWSQSGDAASTLLSRAVSLAEVGLTDGARLAGFGASRDFYFPVPRGMKYGAVLSLVYDTATSFDSQRSIEVLAGDRSLLLKPLTNAQERQTLRIPLDASSAQNGYIKISVRYGRVLADDRCLDIRFGGDHLTILPETALQLSFDRNAVDSVASALLLMPIDVAIYLPGRELEPREFAAALDAARMVRESGRRVTFETLPGADLTSAIPSSNRAAPLSKLAFAPGLANMAPTRSGAFVESAQPWGQGAIVIASGEDLDALAASTRGSLFRSDSKPANKFASTLSLINFGAGPAILVTGDDPQNAARLLGASWSAAAVKSAVSTDSAPQQQAMTGPFTLDRLQADLSTRDVVDRAQWIVPIAAKDLPPKRNLTGLRLNVAVAPDEINSNAVVTAFFNETMMQSVSTKTDMRAQLAFDLPAGLAGLNNSLRVVVQRQPQGGGCTILPTGFPSQLLGSSELLTNQAPEALRDFFEVASQYRDGVTYFVDRRGAFAQRAHLSALAELSGNLVPASARSSVRFLEPGEAPETSGPFIALTVAPPLNSEPPVRFDQGKTIIRGPDGSVVADLGGLKNTAVAQLIRAGLDQGVWIRTAGDNEDLPPPSKLQLDRGNVAVLDRNGVAFAFSTERDRLVQVIYPDKSSLADIANAYRPWVVGALWLAFSLLVVVSVQRFYSRGRNRRVA